MSCSPLPGRINLKPSMWGNTAWMFLYTLAWGYPNNPTPEEKRSALQMFYSMRDMLPCEKCRFNFQAKLKGPLGVQLQDAVSCSGKLFRFVYDLESAVAHTNGKEIPSFEEVQRQVKTNSYLTPAVAASPAHSPASPSVSPRRGLVALWILLPLSVLVTALITYGVASRKKK